VGESGVPELLTPHAIAQSHPTATPTTLNHHPPPPTPTPLYPAQVCVIVDKMEKLPRDKVEEQLAAIGVAATTIDGVLGALSVKSLAELEVRGGGFGGLGGLVGVVGWGLEGGGVGGGDGEAGANRWIGATAFEL